MSKFSEMVASELASARRKFPAPEGTLDGWTRGQLAHYWSAVSREEYDELWKELVQIAAMAQRAAESLRLARRPAESGFWYLASPYAKYPDGRQAAFLAVRNQLANLLVHNVSAYSPIVHNHQVFNAVGKGHDHRFWLNVVDFPLMRAAYGLIVCKLQSWGESKGIKAETEFFTKHNKPVVYMTPGEVPEELLRENES